MELTKPQKTLIDELKEKGFDKDNAVAFLLSLKTDKETTKMADWLINNKNASRDEIFGKWYEIMNIEMPQ